MNGLDQKLETAKTSTCTQTLHDLAVCADATVRRAVARNMNTLSKTLDILANDPVLNVSFMATKNPNCLVQREFEDISNPCVQCDKDERHMVCINCQTLNAYYK